ncbi:MAG: polysaccharide pyruvyl transferase family protein [Muribaculaceae bacterium]|nr:polysaccharide pyruvyl transferase family protein [Muribaculaceae bacterium]
MKKIGIVTYNSLHCNFTNYGTVLQAWALQKAVQKILKEKGQNNTDNVILVNYCPDTMKDKNPLAPFENMWDNDPTIREQARLTLPAIKENLQKIENFYNDNFIISENEYNPDNITEIGKENITAFIVGSDSIWDIEEFGLDNGFFANNPSMAHNSIAYAPSFQDSIETFDKSQWEKAKHMIANNFQSVALRDRHASDIIFDEDNVRYPVVIDPTLTLDIKEYEEIESKENQYRKPYILYYSRRYNEKAERMVDEIARERGLDVVEISLRAQNSDRHFMRYDAGVEEFLTLIKNADVVITNSFHCMIFAILYKKDFYVYSRQHCYGKIVELLQALELTDRFIGDPDSYSPKKNIDYVRVAEKLNDLRHNAKSYLEGAVVKLI